MQLIISDVTVKQDKNGRYCLNDLHKAAIAKGANARTKEPGKFIASPQIVELISEMETTQNLGVKPVEKVEGRNGGTYGCKELVYAYAMWISARFHLHVIRTFDALAAKEQIRISYRDASRIEYKPMTDAIKHEREAQGKSISPHHFSNEADLINRITLGMTSAKFRVHNDIDKKESIRDYLTAEQIHCITELQRANTVFISMGWEFEQRKEVLKAMFERNHRLPLIAEQHRLAA